MKENRMIKVANVIMEGRYGGPQCRIIGVAEKLKKSNIKTIVVFPKNDSALFYKRLTEKGIPARRLSLHRLTREKSHLAKFIIFFIPELFSLYRLFRKEQVDIVHCNTSWQIKGVIAGKLAGAKVVWHLQDTYVPKFIKAIFEVLARRYSDGFITAGERVRQYYLNNKISLGKPIAVIQAPVDTSLFNPEHVKKDERIARCSGLKIITVGNINQAKGLEYFIEMAFILNKKYHRINFFIIGSHFKSQKYYSKKVSKMVKDLRLKNLHFYGPSDDVPSVLKAADIYVCSSITEASPISVWEAMAMAKPIVATDVGDIKKFIKNGENGFIVQPKDAKALAEKVRILIENKDLRYKFGKLARLVAVNELDISICAEKHKNFYLEILNKKETN